MSPKNFVVGLIQLLLSCCTVLPLLLAVLIADGAAMPPLDENTEKTTTPAIIQYVHSAYIDRQQTVLLQWRIGTVQVAEQRRLSFIDAEVAAPTRGYVGLGFSPDGGMIGADILVMWVDDAGVAHMQDRHAVAYAEPLLDPDQSSILDFSGYENATHTVMRFRRTLEAACNDPKHDYSITTSAVRIIHALGERDPDASGHIAYHGTARRGSQTLHMLDDAAGRFERDRTAAQADMTMALEFRAENLTLPMGSTYYQCSYHALPKFNDPMHVVGFEPAVSASSRHVVHHIIVYMCERDFVPDSDYRQFQCYSAQIDTGSQRKFKKMAHCFHSVIWASSGPGDVMYFPRDIGYSLVPADSHRYVLVEMHYDVSQLSAPLDDASGIRIMLTDKLRPHTASHLLLGAAVGSGLLLPGYSKMFTMPGWCGSNCTRKFLPASGITMFFAGLHTHIYGRAVVLRHFRRGIELPVIVGDAAHDFRYQRVRAVNVTILPGDDLLVECNYTTADKANTTWGGWGTHDEMCSAFTFVTPALDMTICVSVLSTEHAMAAIQPENAATAGLNVAAPLFRRRRALLPPPQAGDAAAGRHLIEMQMAELNPPPIHDAIRRSEIGVGIIQDMVGLTTALRDIDWSVRSDAREQLQQSYFFDPHINFCAGYANYSNEIAIPYIRHAGRHRHGPTRPLQPHDLDDITGCAAGSRST